MFSRCNSLDSIYLSNFNTSFVTNMSYMLAECSSIKYLDLSNFNTSLVKDMSNIFYDCSSLESIDISNFDIRNCDNFEYMFAGTDNLIFINLYNFTYSDNYIILFFSEVDCLFVCQKDNIIQYDAYNCCDVNIETRQCESDLVNIPQNETNETNIEITNTIASENNLDYITNSKSSSGISIGIIIGIIAGGVVVLSIIVVIIIYCYRKNKRKENPTENDTSSINIKSTTMEEVNKDIQEYEHEHEKPKINPVTIILMQTNQEKVKIRIESNKKMKELIKFYFKIKKKPELYNDLSITFLKNGNEIKHTSEKTVKEIIGDDDKANIILVADADDKIQSNNNQ